MTVSPPRPRSPTANPTTPRLLLLPMLLPMLLLLLPAATAFECTGGSVKGISVEATLDCATEVAKLNTLLARCTAEFGSAPAITCGSSENRGLVIADNGAGDDCDAAALAINTAVDEFRGPGSTAAAAAAQCFSVILIASENQACDALAATITSMVSANEDGGFIDCEVTTPTTTPTTTTTQTSSQTTSPTTSQTSTPTTSRTTSPTTTTTPTSSPTSSATTTAGEHQPAANLLEDAADGVLHTVM